MDIGVKFRGLWTESYQHIDKKVVSNLTGNKSLADVLNSAFTALALIGFFFYRLFGGSTSKPLDPTRVKTPKPSENEGSVSGSKVNKITTQKEGIFQPTGIKKDALLSETAAVQTTQWAKPVKTIQQRLEKNRVDAETQQNKQESKDGFEFLYVPIYDELYCGESLRESPLTSHSKSLEGFSVGSAECQGERETMEDAELATEGTHKTTIGEFPFKLFGIFDGHCSEKDRPAGAEASKFVADHFLSSLSEQLNEYCADKLTQEGIFKALKETFKKIDADYTGKGGSTGTVALIIDNHLWVANAGDSRTIFVKKDGTIVQASQDQKPEDYKEKIEKPGVQVINGRVQTDEHGKEDTLGVARGFGDHDFRGHDGICCISPNPTITVFPLNLIKFIILACDGVYDVASTNNVGAMIKELDQYQDEEKPDHQIQPEEMAKRLIDAAIRMKTADNVSVMVVKNTAA